MLTHSTPRFDGRLVRPLLEQETILMVPGSMVGSIEGPVILSKEVYWLDEPSAKCTKIVIILYLYDDKTFDFSIFIIKKIVTLFYNLLKEANLFRPCIKCYTCFSNKLKISNSKIIPIANNIYNKIFI